MTGLVPVRWSRAWYEGIVGLDYKDGKIYLVSGIGVDGKLIDHYTQINLRLARKYNENLGALEKVLFDDLREKYPNIPGTKIPRSFKKDGVEYTIPGVEGSIEGIVPKSYLLGKGEEVAPGVTLYRHSKK